MMHPPGYPYVVIHSTCGWPAFWLNRRVGSGEPRLSRDAGDTNGQPMPYNAPVMCRSCGESLPMLGTKDIREAAKIGW